MYPSVGFEDSVDALWNYVYEDGTDVTLIMNQYGTGETDRVISHPQGFGESLISNWVAGTGETEFPISQYQASEAGESLISNRVAGTRETELPISQHQASDVEVAAASQSIKSAGATQKSRVYHATNTREKRRGNPLEDEEKKKRKKMADEKHRNKRKDYVKGLEKDVDDCKRREAVHVSEKESLKTELEDYKRKVQVLASEKKSSDDEVRKTAVGHPELFPQPSPLVRHLNVDYCELQRKNDVLEEALDKMKDDVKTVEAERDGMKEHVKTVEAERDTMKEHLQTVATTIMQLQSNIPTFNGICTQQQQPVDLCSNGLNPTQEFSLEQEQLRQEGNGRLALKTTNTQQQQLPLMYQDRVRKMEEVLQGLKKVICQHEYMNRSLMAERETMSNQLQIATTRITQQQQFINFYSNGLVSEMSQQVEKWNRKFEEAMNDCA